MKIRNLAKTTPILVTCFTMISLCVVTAAFNIPPNGSAAAPAGEKAADGISPIFTPTVQAWSAEIAGWARDYGLDPNLVATVMQIESCGNPQAVSSAGAQGLFQVMPFHFAAGEDMLDAETNARRGLEYLSLSLLKAGGDKALAFAGYNGGHGVIQWDPSEWPAETQRYAYWGNGIYQDAAGGAGESLRLREWLEAGGTRLCVAAEWEMAG